jgi:transaldolase
VKPANLKTKIFLDSGDPAETKEAIRVLGFLDGQTTNPTLIAKNPQVKARIDSGHTYAKTEILEFYKKDVQEISSLIPKGSVSIEVYDDNTTACEHMIIQAKGDANVALLKGMKSLRLRRAASRQFGVERSNRQWKNVG